MSKPDTILDEIHEARQRIEARAQGMSVTQRTAQVNQRGEAAALKYGFTIVQSSNPHPAPKQS